MERYNVSRDSYQIKGQGETPRNDPRCNAELRTAYGEHSGQGLPPPVAHEEGGTPKIFQGGIRNQTGQRTYRWSGQEDLGPAPEDEQERY